MTVSCVRSILVALAVTCLAFGVPLGSPDALASGPAGREIQVPIRWCALNGTSIVGQPGLWGQKLHDFPGALGKLQAKASQYWAPLANIGLRGASTISSVGDTLGIPVINFKNGAVKDPFLDGKADFMTVTRMCRERWDDRTGARMGPVGVVIKRFVDGKGIRTGTLGYGGSTWVTVHPQQGEDFRTKVSLCTPAGRLSDAHGGRFAIVDPFAVGYPYSFTKVLRAGQSVAHELGHVFRLGHGNGEDDSHDGKIDDWCDPGGEPCPKAVCDFPARATLMLPNMSAADPTYITRDYQRPLAQRVARQYNGAVIDPPGELVSTVIADERTDDVGDADPTIDLESVILSVDQEEHTLTISQALAGLAEQPAQFVTSTDLDGDPGTGGTGAGGIPELAEAGTLPADLEGLGVDLVSSVTVADGAIQDFGLWKWTGEVYERLAGVDDVAGGEPIAWPVYQSTALAGSSDPVGDVVSVVVLSDAAGSIPAFPEDPTQLPVPVRLEAVSVGLENGSTDALKDATHGDDAVDFYLMPPAFPVCGVEQESVGPLVDGQTTFFTLEASGFVGDGQVEIALDGDPVDEAVTNGGGFLQRVAVPGDTETGWHAVSVRAPGSTVSAECSLVVASP